MKFLEFENKMQSLGIGSLAEIARKLETTPQAVSNWKSRDQIPLHIVAKINSFFMEKDSYPIMPKEVKKELTFSDILVILSEQLKVIVLIAFLSVFTTFTYVRYIQEPIYESWATILLPDNKSDNLPGLAGLASQFGVNVPLDNLTDLSSPSLYPELLKSRTFAERIFDKKFFIKKYNKELSLLSIITHGDKPTSRSKNSLKEEAIIKLNDKYLFYIEDPSSSFSVIKISTSEAQFSKDLADVVLSELDILNRSLKSKTVNEKTIFIENRIESVKSDLEVTEIKLKNFKEKNRQISSPSLALEEDRLEREVDVQKGIYLTLKQQLELAKIDEVQEQSIVQLLDSPVVPISPANKNIITSLILSFITGITFGIILGFIRNFLQSDDIDERKKLRRTKHFFKKKLIDLSNDKRGIDIIIISMVLFLPFYIGSTDKNAAILGLYSTGDFILNLAYVLILFLLIIRRYQILKIKISERSP